MSDIIERVARAAYECEPVDPLSGWNSVHTEIKAEFRAMARIAVAIALEEAAKKADDAAARYQRCADRHYYDEDCMRAETQAIAAHSIALAIRNMIPKEPAHD